MRIKFTDIRQIESMEFALKLFGLRVEKHIKEMFQLAFDDLNHESLKLLDKLEDLIKRYEPPNPYSGKSSAAFRSLVGRFYPPEAINSMEFTLTSPMEVYPLLDSLNILSHIYTLSPSSTFPELYIGLLHNELDQDVSQINKSTRRTLNALVRSLDPSLSPGASYGIGHSKVPLKAKVAYELYRTIEYRHFWHILLFYIIHMQP